MKENSNMKNNVDFQKNPESAKINEMESVISMARHIEYVYRNCVMYESKKEKLLVPKYIMHITILILSAILCISAIIHGTVGIMGMIKVKENPMINFAGFFFAMLINIWLVIGLFGLEKWIKIFVSIKLRKKVTFLLRNYHIDIPEESIKKIKVLQIDRESCIITYLDQEGNQKTSYARERYIDKMTDSAYLFIDSHGKEHILL